MELEQSDIYIPKINLELYLAPYIKIYSKCIIDLKVKPQTISVLGRNMGGNIFYLGLGKNFLIYSTKAKILNWEKMINWTSLNYKPLL